MKKSIFCKALIVLALVVAVAVPVCAWSGTGTSADPIVLTSAVELEMMNNSSEYFKLGNDIVINDVSKFNFEGGVAAEGAEAWTPIENFSGTLDGANYYITGLYVTDENATGGLFAEINGGTVKNLNVEFALVESDENAGIIAGKVDGVATIDNCMVSGSVIGKKTTMEMNTAGGLVGYVGDEATISNSVSYATVAGATSYSANVGGLVGANHGTITKCGYYGSVMGTATYYDAAIGGIAGSNTGDINNCRNAGDITGESTANINDCYVGGIAGMNKGSVEFCENDYASTVSVKNYSNGDSICAAGGIVGATIDTAASFNTNVGTVLGEYSYCGGIAGIAVSDSGELYIENNDNTGAVNSAYGVAGGIVGRAVAAGEGYVSIKLYISDCYNSATVEGNKAGEIAGETANVESASVTIGVESASANANTCSAPSIREIVANAVQYGDEATGTTQAVSGTGGVGSKVVVGTDSSEIKVIRFKKRTAFAPAPVIVKLIYISDADIGNVVAKKVDVSGLKYENGRITGEVVVEVYRPEGDTTAYNVVVGTSVITTVDDAEVEKFVSADFAVVTGTDRYTYVKVPIDCEASDANAISINALVVDSTKDMDPVCENIETTKEI